MIRHIVMVTFRDEATPEERQTMMETVKAFADLPLAPRRSLVFLAVTGEEKGLLGSDYIAANTTVPSAAIETSKASRWITMFGSIGSPLEVTRLPSRSRWNDPARV